MSQETRVFTLEPAAARGLLQRLQAELPGDAEWRLVPHAVFQVKADGVVATCYASGKLVVQGQALDAFVARFLGDATQPAEGRATREGDVDLPLDRPMIGSDEAGKGDYFGPLVVVAVVARPSQAAELGRLGIRDSKTLSDDRARLLAGRVEAMLDHAIVKLEPPEYNSRWQMLRNVNALLGEMHARAIATLSARNADVELAVVDQFGAEHWVADPLRATGARPLPLVQVPRAERNLAVAAASIIARAAFLDGIAACSDACGADLHLGAGEPVDAAARRVVAIGGAPLLATVAKLHFKNTSRVVKA